jgi:tRNA threonylcarbamoyladenosine biosynthesis protein TsaE
MSAVLAFIKSFQGNLPMMQPSACREADEWRNLDALWSKNDFTTKPPRHEGKQVVHEKTQNAQKAASCWKSNVARRRNVNTAPDHDDCWRFASSNEGETKRLGLALGAVVTPGTVVALVGDLGAGKTRFVQAVAEALEVEGQQVNSPTFVLIQEYEGRLPVYHFDTYRLRDTDEFLELGADEMLAGDGVCFVEWADRVADVLPRDIVRVEIEITGRDDRVFHIQSTGPRSSAVVGDWQTCVTDGPTTDADQ